MQLEQVLEVGLKTSRWTSQQVFRDDVDDYIQDVNILVKSK